MSLEPEQVIFILKIITAIPLVFYPMVLMANVMSLAGHKSGKESTILKVTSYSFLISTTLYPLTFLYSLYYNTHNSYFIGILPIIHIVICIILMKLWAKSE